jgi:hypothetical protein
MLEIYCDSSFNEGEDSYIGCTILRDNRQIHQSTTKIPNNPESSLHCEFSALDLAVTLAKVFSANDKEIIIYNDSTEAVKFYQAKKKEIETEFSGTIYFEYIPREKVNQAVADSLSKKFPFFPLNIPNYEVESFSRREDILLDIGQKGANVFYLEKAQEMSTKKKVCYKLIIVNIEKILANDRTYLVKKGGPGTQIKAAEAVRKDLSEESIVSSLKARGVRFENSYFLLTDDTWGLRSTDNKAFSILPNSIPHKIICDEVDRSPENLFSRAENFK